MKQGFVLGRAFLGSLGLELEAGDHLAGTGIDATEYVLVDGFPQVLDSFHLVDRLICQSLGFCLLVRIGLRCAAERRTFSMAENGDEL